MNSYLSYLAHTSQGFLRQILLVDALRFHVERYQADGWMLDSIKKSSFYMFILCNTNGILREKRCVRQWHDEKDDGLMMAWMVGRSKGRNACWRCFKIILSLAV